MKSLFAWNMAEESAAKKSEINLKYSRVFGTITELLISCNLRYRRTCIFLVQTEIQSDSPYRQTEYYFISVEKLLF